MRSRSPSSHAIKGLGLSLPDIGVAAFAPFLALYLRDTHIFAPGYPAAIPIYWGLCFVFSLIAFAAFRIHGAIPRYFSIGDFADLALAVLATEMSACVVLFSLTRLDGIPRSIPAIHALILGAGLVAVRAARWLLDENLPKAAAAEVAGTPEHIIVIGISDLSALLIKFLGASFGGRRRVIALLDENPHWFGRAVDGVPVLGPPSHLASLVGEFATHGIRADYVVMDRARAELPADTLSAIEQFCREHGIRLKFVPEFFAVDFEDRRIPIEAEAGAAPQAVPIRHAPAIPAIVPSGYFRCRRMIDLAVASVLLVVLCPLWLAGAAIALFDVGMPILFWQQRAGHRGRAFHLYKIRTLHAPYDRSGRRIPEDQRTSWSGRLLRQTRLDEIPQLFNVLVGDMGLIGPRPLLPQDQPENPATRLAVRPGITGWAQVNGGTLLTPAEKDELDAWYIANASPWVDLRIVALTLRSLVKGDRRSDAALARARTAAAVPRVIVTSRFTRGPEPVPAEEARRSAASSV